MLTRSLRFINTFTKYDLDQLWLDLCLDKLEAKNAIRAFFRDYIESAQATRPVLGEEEYETVQTITTTKTAISYWKHLVGEADNTILREKRREDPDNRKLWKLRWDQGEPSDRPVADISDVRRFVSSVLFLESVFELTMVVDPRSSCGTVWLIARIEANGRQGRDDCRRYPDPPRYTLDAGRGYTLPSSIPCCAPCDTDPCRLGISTRFVDEHLLQAY